MAGETPDPARRVFYEITIKFIASRAGGRATADLYTWIDTQVNPLHLLMTSNAISATVTTHEHMCMVVNHLLSPVYTADLLFSFGVAAGSADLHAHEKEGA
jgi:hypothetical protein